MDENGLIEFAETGGEVGTLANRLYGVIEDIAKLKNGREALATLVQGLGHALEHPGCFNPGVGKLAKEDLKKVILTLICVDFFPHLEKGRYMDVSNAMGCAIDSLNESGDASIGNLSDVVH